MDPTFLPKPTDPNEKKDCETCYLLASELGHEARSEKIVELIEAIVKHRHSSECERNLP